MNVCDWMFDLPLITRSGLFEFFKPVLISTSFQFIHCALVFFNYRIGCCIEFFSCLGALILLQCLSQTKNQATVVG